MTEINKNPNQRLETRRGSDNATEHPFRSTWTLTSRTARSMSDTHASAECEDHPACSTPSAPQLSRQSLVACPRSAFRPWCCRPRHRCRYGGWTDCAGLARHCGCGDPLLRRDLDVLKAAAHNRILAPADLQNPTTTLSNFGMPAGRHAALVVPRRRLPLSAPDASTPRQCPAIATHPSAARQPPSMPFLKRSALTRARSLIGSFLARCCRAPPQWNSREPASSEPGSLAAGGIDLPQNKIQAPSNKRGAISV